MATNRNDVTGSQGGVCDPFSVHGYAVGAGQIADDHGAIDHGKAAMLAGYFLESRTMSHSSCRPSRRTGLSSGMLGPLPVDTNTAGMRMPRHILGTLGYRGLKRNQEKEIHHFH